jgi:endogenous inhibitor of DNA gyrase (YacG/DUF329 family)
MNAVMNMTVREVACPACRGPSRFASDNPYRPFCCARCKNVDFGAWANEEFKLASPPILDDDLDAPPQLLQ